MHVVSGNIFMYICSNKCAPNGRRNKNSCLYQFCLGKGFFLFSQDFQLSQLSLCASTLFVFYLAKHIQVSNLKKTKNNSKQYMPHFLYHGDGPLDRFFNIVLQYQISTGHMMSFNLEMTKTYFFLNLTVYEGIYVYYTIFYLQL